MFRDDEMPDVETFSAPVIQPSMDPLHSSHLGVLETETDDDYSWLDAFSYHELETESVDPPDWVIEAARDNLRTDLAAAASGPPSSATAAALELACPPSDSPKPTEQTIGSGSADSVSVGPAELDATGLLAGVAGLARLINWAQALQQRYIAALARPGVAVPFDDLIDLAASPLGMARQVPDVPVDCLTQDRAWSAALREAAMKAASVEIGAVLNMSPLSARNRTEAAVTMVEELPATLAAQQRGEIDSYRASIVADRTMVLSPEQRREIERELLPLVASRTPSRVRHLVDRHVARMDPEAAARREAEARAHRGTRVSPGPDGMAAFYATVSAPDAQLAQGVLDRIATATRAAGLATGRGQGQLRADAFTALFHDLATTGRFRVTNSPEQLVSPAEVASVFNTATFEGSTAPTNPNIDADCIPSAVGKSSGKSARGSRARLPINVNVYVKASTLAGFDDEPAELAGHGIISAEMARDIATSAASIRAIVASPFHPGDAPSSTSAATSAASTSTVDTGHSDNLVRTRYCGTVFDAGRTVYRPPERIVATVVGRDRTCRFPGCASNTARCDLDHRRAFDRTCLDAYSNESGGATCPCNLDALCRFHHLIKTFTSWQADPSDDGTLLWTAPTGSAYATETGHLLYDAVPIAAVVGAGDDPPPF